ncbi:hypothetical protein GIB67_016032 [Kingdonia uniflora]|uniref:DNA polymerase Y-family little finger domain-containing protein n=1 Tax=Kingdonia uniflora TaxID=39325 RepID=A0A7J7L1S1_9MAGN|nr:hypothetical protein GIB67_016032 [Kingdonia uniflora]
MLVVFKQVESWLNDLSEELSERIQSDFDTNKRVAHTLTLHARAYKTNDSDSHKKFPSRSCPLRYGTPKIQEDAMKLFDSGLREFLSSYRIDIQGNQSNTWGVTALSISASKILFTTPVSMPKTNTDDINLFAPSTAVTIKNPDDGFATRIIGGSGTKLRVKTAAGTSGIKGAIAATLLGLPAESIKFAIDLIEVPEGVQGRPHDKVLEFDGKSDADAFIDWLDKVEKFFKYKCYGDPKQNKDPSCSSEQPCDEVFHNTLLLGASGTENGSELDKNEAEKTEINCIRPLLDQEEQKKEIPNHKGTSSILKFFHSQDPSCSSSKQPCNEVFHETLPLVTSGTENRSELNKNEAEETVINCIGPLLGREEQKIETPNHKGTNSILRFFQTQSSSGSSSQQACNGLSGDNIQSSSTSCVPNINNDRSKWSFNVEDIDPSVVDELPPEIQDEIRGLLRPVKRANTAKRGSSISHYFSPSKRK